MAHQQRREREKEAVRKKILDAARRLFIDQGYEAVTMRKIAKAIEYSPTAIYLHFRDKKAVMEAICDTDFLKLATRFRRIAEIADPIERLRAAGFAYSDFAMKHPNHYRMMFMTPHPPHDPRKSALDVGNRDEDAYAFVRWTASEAIAQGRIREDLADPELLAQMVWASIHGWVSLRMTKSNQEWVDWRPTKSSIEAMVEMTIRGVIGSAPGGIPESPSSTKGAPLTKAVPKAR